MKSPAAFRAKRSYKKREVEPLQQRLERHVMPLAECGCWIWERQLDDNGYGTIRIDGAMTKAHRASWAAFKGPIPRGTKVLHQCDIRCCVNPDHLFLGTQLDNMQDMISKGRQANFAGEANTNSKLTESQVAEIRESPLGYVELGKRYGVGKSMIGNIKTGKNWTHL